MIKKKDCRSISRSTIIRMMMIRPYYERFLKALPDVAALAACPEDQLMKLWEGLGYYNRVRNMQKAAVTVTEEYDGVLPADYGKLLELKGIGSYTAGAIASIAYGIPVPAVDGNVLRILTRVAADDTDIMKQSFRSAVEAQLGEMMRELTVPEELRRVLRDENVPGARSPRPHYPESIHQYAAKFPSSVQIGRAHV